MINKLVLLLLMTAVGASVFADGRSKHNVSWDDNYKVYEEEAALILARADSTPMGEITLSDMREIALDLSIPIQKMQFVKESEYASAFLPGIGQYMNNAPLSGTLYLVSSIAVTAGTLYGAYSMLPDELKFDSLDYYRDSEATINARWEDQSIQDMLPTVGVLAAGFAVNGIIRLISAAHAGNLAQKNIEEGKIKFEPKLLVSPFRSSGHNESNGGSIGLGLGMSY